MIDTIDGRNPAWPYIYFIYQKYGHSGSIVHLYVHNGLQDFYR